MFKNGNADVNPSSSSGAGSSTYTVTLASNTTFTGFVVTFGYISGSCGTNATWTLSKQNGQYSALTISGSGAMNNYGHTTVDDLWRTNAPWDWQDLKTVTIGNDITSIGDYAFIGCQQLSSLSIGSGVTTIGTNAFDHCDALTNITLPQKVSSIGNGAFKNSKSLTAVTLNANVSSIGNEAFSYCDELTRVNIQREDGVTTLGSNCFNGCNKLQYIVAPTLALAMQYKTATNWNASGSKMSAKFGDYVFYATNEGGTDAYAITCEDDLRYLATAIRESSNGVASGNTFRQTANIALGSTNFIPIGGDNDERYFSGTYDGGGYTISGLQVNTLSGFIYYGLFGYVKDGTVKNVRLISPSVNTNAAHCISAFIGKTSNATVQNSVVITPTIEGSSGYRGVIIGHCENNSSLQNLYFYGGNYNNAFGPIDSSCTNTNSGRARKVTLGSGISSVTPDATSMDNGFVYNNETYYREGLTLTLTTNLSEKSGYHITYKANTDKTISSPYTVNSTDGDVTFTAVYTANTYTVHFDGNGYTSGSMSDQAFTYGTAQNLSAIGFSRTGYTFDGWNTKADGSGTSYTNQQSVSNLTTTDGGTVTLYAKWTPVNFTITYNLDGGSVATANPTSYNIETPTITLNNPTKPGCNFLGWYNNPDFEGEAVTTIAHGSMGNVELWAKWFNSTSYYFGPGNDGSAEHPYTISTKDGWNYFCDALDDNNTYNHFSGKTVKLAADISVTRQAGSSGYDFSGTFDGQGHTLNIDFTGTQYAAPFFYVKSQDNDHPATIQNLKVSGTVTASGKFAAGIAGGCAGKVNITNCLVSTTISSSVNGDGTDGGLVGVFDGGTLNITGCAFTGKLLSTGSAATTQCGGFVGYSHVNGTAVNITNSLYAPAALVGSETEPTSNSMTFLRSTNTTVNITNSYYTRTLGTAQGKAKRTVTAGTGVSISGIAPVGSETATYTVSGIKTYAKGITRTVDNVTTFYYGEGDDVSLTLSNTPSAGYIFSGYTASAGTLAGTENLYTLTMTDEDVTVTATFSPISYSITYNLNGGTLETDKNSYTIESSDITLDSPTRTGYTFLGWYNNEDLTGDAVTTIAHGSTGNVELWAKWAMGTISYIAADGDEQGCSDYTVLTGNESNLAAGWYVAEGKLNYSSGITLNGDVHLILKDGAVMNIGTAQSPVSEEGIDAGSHTISIYAQSTGDSKGQLTINASWDGIYADGGNVEIKGGKVEATGGGNNHGIFALKNGDNSGCITLKNATVTASGYYGICAQGGLIINSGTVTANGNYYGIFAGGCDLTINGGKVTATATSGDGIGAYNGNITLGWTDASDYIYASSYSADGTLSIASGKEFIDDDGNTYSGTIAKKNNAYPIDGKTLRPFNGPRNLTVTDITTASATLTWEARGDETQWQVSWSTDNGSTWNDPVTVNECQYELTGLSASSTVHVKVQAVLGEGVYSDPSTRIFDTPLNYLDKSGFEQGCSDYTVLTGSETRLAAGWYVAEGMLNYSSTITLDGDVHLILKDGAVMNIGTAQSPVSEEGIYGNRHSISIYAQSTGDSKGQLTINASEYGIYANGGNVGIYGGEVEATGGGSYYGIYASKISGNGGCITLTNATVTASGNYGIYANIGGLIINSCTVKANGNGNSKSALYADNCDLIINGGKVTATSTSGHGIYAKGGNVEIKGGEVEATGGGSNHGIFAYKSGSNGGFITLSNATVTASGGTGIRAEEGGLTINSGTVTANGYFALYADGCDLTINGGKVTATATSGSGIFAEGGNITLGWTDASDYIYASSYSAGGTLSIANGKEFIDEDGNTYSGTIAKENNAYPIDGKTLRPSNGSRNLTVTNITTTSATLTWEAYGDETQWQVSWSTDNGSTWSKPVTVTQRQYELTGLSAGSTVRVRVQAVLGEGVYSAPATCIFGTPLNYLDISGVEQGCSDYTVLTGTETDLAAGWYVADGTLNFSQQITLNGDVHLILKDGAVMNVGTAQSPIIGDGIYGNGHSLSIYAQSTCGDKGQLNVDATNTAINVYPGDINICGGKVTVKGRSDRGINKGTGTLNIVAGEVTATGGSTGIHAGGGSVNISGGKVTANGSSNGIFSSIDITISGGEVTATGNNGIEGGGSTLNISGGKVTANGSSYGIYGSSKDITISGGQVEANGGRYGIYSEGSNIYLGWTNPTDFIHANSYWVNYSSTDIILNNTFFDEDGNSYSGTIAKVNDAYAIDGKTLRPNIAVLKGDANGDGVVNVTDIMAVANYILNIGMTVFDATAADVNGDNVVNVTDIMGIANIILNVTPSSNSRANSEVEDTLEPQ